MIRSHKIRLRPTTEQAHHLQRAFAAARHAWNWGKEILDAEYDYNRQLYNATGENHPFIRINAANKETGQRSLKMWYNQIKPSWVCDKTASATQEAFADLQRGIKRYFDIRKGKVADNSNGKRKDGRLSGWLNWRTKRNHNSFRATNIYLRLDGPYIRYNANVGFIRMCEELRFDGKLMNATFSYDGEWYWVSIQVEIPHPKVEPKPGVVGVDLGIKYLAVTSDGQIIDNPKMYYRAQAKLRRLQRKLDRQRRANNPDCYRDDGTFIKGKKADKKSNQMERTESQIKRLHSRIAQVRRDTHHQLTASLTRDYGAIFVEDLNVSGMLKNRKLSKSISDAGFSEIRRQLEYKTENYDGIIGVIDQWFPSSKLCSSCGEKKLDLELSDREWTCDNCNTVNHRDLNAAINIRDEGVRLYLTPPSE